MHMQSIKEREPAIPLFGALAADPDPNDPKVKERKSLADKLKRGQKVSVTPTGTLVDPNSPEAKEQGKELNVPDGKLASYYWYERDPKLLAAEKKLMRDSFPQFTLGELDDGRLYWEGTVKPCGEDELEWTLMAVYDNDHDRPKSQRFGGSVKIYSLDPSLDMLTRELGRELPHVLYDGEGRRYMCTARQKDVDSGILTVTSASMSLRWALKWTFAVTLWLNGEIGDEIYSHGLI